MSSDESSPYGSVLQVDDSVRILLDCGSDGDFSPEVTARIAEVAPTIDLVLLSHHDLRHLGALAVAYRHGLTAPVFATLPCVKLGTMSVYEAWLGFAASRGREPATRLAGSLEEIDGCMQRIRTMKFDQPLELRGKGSGIVITAHRCGYTVGGAMWRIRSRGEDVAYCVDYRHAAERHSPAAAVDFYSSSGGGQRPSVVITDARALDREDPSPAREPSGRRLPADRQLVDACLERLRSGGNVLIPVDATTRLLEISLILDEVWREKKLGGAYDLVAVHSMVRNVVELSRCQLEWMAPNIQRDFDNATTSKKGNKHPIGLREVRVATTVEEALGVNSEFPKCIVASRAELDYGASAAIARKFVENPANLIVSTSRTFYSKIDEFPRSEWSVGYLKPLVGAELEEYHQKRDKERADKELDEANMKRASDLAAALLDEEEDDEDRKEEQQQREERNEQRQGVVEVNEDEDPSASSASRKRQRIENLIKNPWFDMTEAEKRATADPMLPWLALHKKQAREPAPDEYGQPVPDTVLRAIEGAKSSLLLGLETREGFSHLKGGGSSSLGEDGEEAQEEGAISDADAPPPRQLGDVAYDDGEEDEPYVWTREIVSATSKCRRLRVAGLDGLCDARSLKNFLTGLRPRAVLVLPSPKADDLASFVGPIAQAPKPGAAADLSSVLGRAPLVDVDIDWNLVERVNKRQVEIGQGLKVVRIHDAVLSENNETLSIDEDAPPNLRNRLWVASKDLVLPSLLGKLHAKGISAHLKAGVLVCAGNILVKKSYDEEKDDKKKKANVRIEGPLCPEYYQVAAVLKTALTLV